MARSLKVDVHQVRESSAEHPVVFDDGFKSAVGRNQETFYAPRVPARLESDCFHEGIALEELRDGFMFKPRDPCPFFGPGFPGLLGSS